MVNIARDEKTGKPFSAFVRFNKKEDALKAVSNHQKITVNEFELECNSYQLDSKQKNPNFQKPADLPQSEGLSLESCKFKNLPSYYTEEQAKALFEEYGIVENLNYNQETGSGFVSYKSHGAVTKVIQGLNGRKFGDQTVLIIDTSDKKKNASQYNNLFIGGIDPDSSEEEIKEFFGKYGEIESFLRPTRVVNINGEQKTVNKPFVYISFKDPRVASDIIKELDGQYFNNKKLDIDFYDPQAKFANKKDSKGGMKNAPNSQIQQTQNMLEQFMQAMVIASSAVVNNMNNSRGRGGYGRGNSRGMYNNNRGSRGGRGAPRGSYPGQIKTRPQYDQPKHMMGVPMSNPIPRMPHSMGGQMYQLDSGMGMVGGNIPSPPKPYQSSQPIQMSPQMPLQMPAQMPAPMPQQMPPQIPTHQPQPVSEQEPKLGVDMNGTTYYLEELESMSKEEQDNILGTYLYDKLDPLCGGDMAGKITGMFLDLQVQEVFQIATEEDAFDKYYQEAIALISQEDQS
jgi:RNA recognition motif-containing protein